MGILVPQNGDGGKLDLAALKSPIEIGRRPGCAISLEGKGVSRSHARITREGEAFILEDLGSTHGTQVNGSRVEGLVRLKHGDWLGIGEKIFVFSEPSSNGKSRTEHSSSKSKGSTHPARSEKGPEEDPKFAPYREFSTGPMMEVKERLHERVLSKLNLAELGVEEIEKSEMREKVGRVLDESIREIRHELPRAINLELFREVMEDELIGFGPIAPMLRDVSVDEVMVNGPDHIFVERRGRVTETGSRFMSNRHIVNILQRIVEPLGRHIDEASPMVDARLPDGSRVNAIIPPLALDGPSITIRKFFDKKLTTDDLIGFGSMTPEIALFLEEAVRARMNVIVSGGTGSGKTTLLNVLSQFIPRDERLVTIEDSAELKLDHRNLVRLETRPPNVEGKGKVAIRDLVVNSLRMRPDRIIVGECRGPEALDMLQAMNTGHDGSLTTVHANNPRDALARLENLVMMAGFDLPSTAIREQVASAVDILVQQMRLPDGSRKITHITEITGTEEGVVLTQDIFLFKSRGFNDQGDVVGEFVATGNIPRFVEALRQKGDLRLDIGVFVPQH